MKARIGAQYAIACVIIFSPLFVFAAPPKDVKAGVGDEFDIPEKSQPNRYEILEKLRENAKKNPPKHTPTRIQSEMDAVQKALDEEKALLRNLEETTRKQIAEDLEKNTKRMNRDLLEKDLNFKKRLKLLEMRDKTLPKIHPLNIKQAEWNIFRYETALSKLKKLKGGAMMVPVIVGALMGIDGSPEAVAGSITNTIVDFKAEIKRREERGELLEEIKARIIESEKKYDEKIKEIENIRLYLTALDIKTAEEFYENEDAVTAQGRMIKLQKEANELLMSIKLKALIEKEIEKIEAEIKDLEARKDGIPKIK